MIHVLVGNIFESKAQTLVNTVNCVGIMGKGLALEFKKRFPVMYEDYVARCKAKGVQLGEPYLYSKLPSPWILNFPTKGHWRSASRLSDIVSGLKYLEKHYHEWEITSLAVPALGCQNGLLEWHTVGPLLYQHLSQLDIPVELYAPYGTPQGEIEIAFLSQSPVESSQQEREKMNPAYIGLVEIIACIEREPYHWPIGRTIFQKIAYFSTELGLPTGLRFVRESYGPFSPDVSPLLARLVNNGLIQEVQLGKMFALKLGPKYADIAQEFQTELAQWVSIIDRVTDLFLRMRTQQAEVAATIHFTAQTLQHKSGDTITEKAIFEGVKYWKQRRRPPLQDQEIAQAIRDLNLLGWIQAQPSPELPFAEKDEELLLDV
jgi:O-acetyl-ADP-ribose deacetylase (regulator of RNase III)